MMNFSAEANCFSSCISILPASMFYQFQETSPEPFSSSSGDPKPYSLPHFDPKLYSLPHLDPKPYSIPNLDPKPYSLPHLDPKSYSIPNLDPKPYSLPNLEPKPEIYPPLPPIDRRSHSQEPRNKINIYKRKSQCYTPTSSPRNYSKEKVDKSLFSVTSSCADEEKLTEPFNTSTHTVDDKQKKKTKQVNIGQGV